MDGKVKSMDGTLSILLLKRFFEEETGGKKEHDGHIIFINPHFKHTTTIRREGNEKNLKKKRR